MVHRNERPDDGAYGVTLEPITDAEPENMIRTYSQLPPQPRQITSVAPNRVLRPKMTLLSLSLLSLLLCVEEENNGPRNECQHAATT